MAVLWTLEKSAQFTEEDILGSFKVDLRKVGILVRNQLFIKNIPLGTDTLTLRQRFRVILQHLNNHVSDRTPRIDCQILENTFHRSSMAGFITFHVTPSETLDVGKFVLSALIRCKDFNFQHLVIGTSSIVIKPSYKKYGAAFGRNLSEDSSFDDTADA